MRSTVLLLAAASIALLAAACTPDQPPAPVVESVANETLGVLLDPLPPDFVVAVNDGRRLELEPAVDKVGGRVVFEVGDEEPEVNLLAAVKRHQLQVEQMPGADYKGGQELVTPHGSAFYSRGRFLTGTELVENTVIVLKHPSANRLLIISYRYPAGGDSSIRVQQLLDLLSVLQGPGSDAAAGDQ
jgi:hypothetical protein